MGRGEGDESCGAAAGSERNIEAGAAADGSAKEEMNCPHFVQKLMAEVFGTFFIIFAGCGSVAVNVHTDGTVSFPGISITWGLVVTVMVYTLGHISGAHFNPAVTISFATCRRFPWKQVPAYIFSQVLGSTLASAMLGLLFGVKHNNFVGTKPAGSVVQALVLEFVITFYLMFVVSGVGTDDRAVGELAGLAVGATVLLNVLFAGPITGASMNPARSLGPAMVWRRGGGLWVYIVGPICGAVAGAWAYNAIRSPASLRKRSFLKKQEEVDKRISISPAQQ